MTVLTIFSLESDQYKMTALNMLPIDFFPYLFGVTRNNFQNK